MPPLIGLLTITVSGWTAGAIALANLGLSLFWSSVAFGVSKLLQPTPPKDLSVEQAIRIGNTLDPAAPRLYLAGECLLGGVITYRESAPDADGNTNYVFHQIISLCAAPRGTFQPLQAVTSIGSTYFGGYPIHTEHLIRGIDPDTSLPDSDADHLVVEQGRYGSETDEVIGTDDAWVFVEKDVGLRAAGTSRFQSLIASSSLWTSEHVGKGIAKLYTQFLYGPGRFVNGIPEISVRARGMALLDPRDMGYPASEFRYTNNPAIWIAWYMTCPISEDGLGLDHDDLDLDSFEAAANVCDEFVDTNPFTHTVTFASTQDKAQVNLTDNLLYTDLFNPGQYTPIEFITGDRVQLSAVIGSLPTGLSAATDYYVVVIEASSADSEGKLKYDNGDFGDGDILPCIALCTSYADAMGADPDDFVNITAVTDCTFNVTKTGEPRYTYDNVIDTSRPKREILQEMVQACAGELIPSGGKWVLKAGAYEAATVAAFDENDVIGDISIQTNVTSSEQFNQIIGQHISSITADNAQSYPPVNSGQGQEEDGRVLPYTLDLPATARREMAQRIAKISLLDSRQPIRFSAPFSLAKGLQVRGGDTIEFSNTRMGWTEKEFRVLKWQFENVGSDDAPLFAVRMDLKETAEFIYDDDFNELTVEDPLPPTDLPNPWVVAPPTALVVEEDIVDFNSVRALATATASWTASVDQYVVYYEMEYVKFVAGSDIQNVGPIYATAQTVNDLEAGVYIFRVRAVNELGAKSAWVSILKEIIGLNRVPQSPTGFRVVAIGGNMALATWDQSPDVHVRLGGANMLRIDEGVLTDTPEWSHSVSIGSSEGVDGALSSAILPLKTGWYCLKHISVAGIESQGAAFAFCEQVSSVTYTSDISADFDPAFDGDLYNVQVDGSDNIELVPTGTIVEPEGTYYPDLTAYSGLFDDHAGDFDDGGDFDSSFAYISGGGTRRITSVIDSVVISGLDTDFDTHAGMFDDGGDFDGFQGADADCWMEFRKTDDDPGDPAAEWTDWQRIDSGELSYTGLELRTQHRSWQANTQIDIGALGVRIDTPA